MPRKSDCTPEEWAEHLARSRAYYQRNRERILPAKREYASRPEVKAQRKKSADTEAAALRRKQRQQSEESRARRRELTAQKRKDPAWMAKRRSDQRKRRTGMSDADVERMLDVQCGRCAVCQRSFEGRQVRADHCHDSGKPRGLLCHHCNIIEGMIRSMEIDPITFAERLVEYAHNPPFLKLSL